MCRTIVFWLICLSSYLLVVSKNANMTTEPPDHRLEECITETKADKNLVKRLKAGNWRRTNVPLKKWAFCYIVKQGIMSRNAVLKQDVVLRDISKQDKADVEKIINKCLYKKAHEPVETAWHYLACFHASGAKYAKLANKI